MFISFIPNKCEFFARVSEESSKEEDDLLLMSARKVKRKTDEGDEMECDNGNIREENKTPYKEKLLACG